MMKYLTLNVAGDPRCYIDIDKGSIVIEFVNGEVTPRWTYSLLYVTARGICRIIPEMIPLYFEEIAL